MVLGELERMKMVIYMNNNKKIGYHITHNDADAVGCAYVAWHLDTEILDSRYCKVDFKDRIYFCAIGYQDKVISDIYDDIISGNKPIPEVFIVSDLSITEESCELLEKLSSEFGTELLGFDHHKTNNLNRKHKWFKVIKRPMKLKDGRNVNVSAAMYMFKTFIKEGRIPNNDWIDYIYNIILTISDYDVWNWKNNSGYYGQDYGYDADIVQIVCSILGPSVMLDTLIDDYDIELYPQIWDTIYQAQIDFRDRYLKSIPSKTKIYETHGYKIAMFIGENQYTNAGADFINSNYPVDVVMSLFPSNNAISLRTKRDDMDVSDHAKKYFHGGGHPQAAGGRINDNMEFLEILRLFYIDTIPLEEWIKDHEQ